MKRYIVVIMLIVACVLQGCSQKDNGNDASKVKETENKIDDANESITDEPEENITSIEKTDEEKTDDDTNVDTKAEDKEEIEIETEVEVKLSKEETSNLELWLPMVTNSSSKVRIQTVSANSAYKYNTYIISSINGENVVVDPTVMPSTDVVDINPAAILSTHSHPDHMDNIFTDKYECQKLISKMGEIDTTDFHIYSIASAHDGDNIAEVPNNVLFVFEVDGLRIAHMGDIGQSVITEEQLTQLGEIDIAFMQFENSYSNMTLQNEKGFTMIEQLNPKIIIPTHYTANTIPVLEDRYGEIIYFENILEISKEDLPSTTMNMYLIENNHKY
ncbi:MAG TPA: MBL fold metallo-hydrolase [Mobilitalea sp.]|nr:MBL fold metallo-hydrolase [Mobilitalea sp.]